MTTQNLQLAAELEPAKLAPTLDRWCFSLVQLQVTSPSATLSLVSIASCAKT